MLQKLMPLYFHSHLTHRGSISLLDYLIQQKNIVLFETTASTQLLSLMVLYFTRCCTGDHKTPELLCSIAMLFAYSHTHTPVPKIPCSCEMFYLYMLNTVRVAFHLLLLLMTIDVSNYVSRIENNCVMNSYSNCSR